MAIQYPRGKAKPDCTANAPRKRSQRERRQSSRRAWVRRRNKGRVDNFPTIVGVKGGSFKNFGQIFSRLRIVVSEMIWLPISEL
uniref:Uncharacterized protein n=1 Tax=Cucumis sativus TaxID=3659 RepID=A0A0A0LTW6_CUCSA